MSIIEKLQQLKDEECKKLILLISENKRGNKCSVASNMVEFLLEKVENAAFKDDEIKRIVENEKTIKLIF